MTKKVACRDCESKFKADEAPDKCPKCGGDDWKKVYKARAPKEDAEPKKKKAKKASKKTARKKSVRVVDVVAEKKFAILARAVNDTLPHTPQDAFIAFDGNNLAGFSVKAPSVNDEEYLIPLVYLNEVVYLWLSEHPGTWAFEIIEPQIARTIEAISYTQALTTGDPSIDGGILREAAKLTPSVAEEPRFAKQLAVLPPKGATQWNSATTDDDTDDELSDVADSMA